MGQWNNSWGPLSNVNAYLFPMLHYYTLRKQWKTLKNYSGLKNYMDTKLWKMISYFDQIGNVTTKTKEKTLENTNTIKTES